MAKKVSDGNSGGWSSGKKNAAARRKQAKQSAQKQLAAMAATGKIPF